MTQGSAVRKRLEVAMRPVPPPAPIAAVRRSRPGRLPRIAKFALPLLAIATAGLIFAWSHVNLEVVRLQISDSALAPQEVDTISMSNVQFAGIDAKNRSFNVTATLATQEPDDADVVHLQQPKAEIVLDDGAHVAVDADAGQLQRTTQLLDLSGAVKLVQDRGYEFHTSKARIDLGQHTATGDAPVEGKGPDGNVQAQGFQIVDQGTRVIFLGRTRAVFTPKQDQATP